MPNRIIREGILTSTRVNALDWEEEVFYRRLLSYVDDYGRCEAHAALLRAALFPLKIDQVRETTIVRLLKAVEKAGLIRVYEVNGKRFLEVNDFRQQVRSNSKHPSPDDAQPRSVCAASAKQPRANAHLGVSVSEGVVGDVSVDAPQSAAQSKRAPASRPESVADAVAYFATLGGSAFEAETFFDHFQANGWRQGGKTPMRDWQAAARNWFRRSAQAPRGAAAGLGDSTGGKKLLRGGGRDAGMEIEDIRVSLPVAGLDEAMAEVGLAPDGQPLAAAQEGGVA